MCLETKIFIWLELLQYLLEWSEIELTVLPMYAYIQQF